MRRFDSAALAQSYARAEQVTATWARSFHFASRFLPSAKRRAVFARSLSASQPSGEKRSRMLLAE